MLGRLARWLRLLGYDAPLLPEPPRTIAEDEVLLTRRLRLQGRPRVVFIARDHLEDQLRQVVSELGLAPDPKLFFSRCLDCNLPVEPIDRAQAAGLAPDYVLDTAQSFNRCPGCGRIFWPGSHGQRAAQRLTAILGLEPSDAD
ncbi:MAG: hypothetical protein C4525_08645 [Desulfarculus sp.]|jgi:uncharacterized protein with PIN domain|nr:MAG: hypothetical protein C4525_08645 [Desulfarculus sp.]